jgi:hypothetical protein
LVRRIQKACQGAATSSNKGAPDHCFPAVEALAPLL